MSHLEENARLSHELEEARDTIERLIAEKAGIARQRDDMKRQLDKAITEMLEAKSKPRSIAEDVEECPDCGHGLIETPSCEACPIHDCGAVRTKGVNND